MPHPKFGSLKPASRSPHRVAEYSRTYLTSSPSAGQRDVDVVDHTFTFPEHQSAGTPSVSKMRRTKSEEAFSNKGDATENPTHLALPNINSQHYVPSNAATYDPSILPNDLPQIVTPHPLSVSQKAWSAPPMSSSRPSTPQLPWHRRPRILFYHKHDPHYGFTNFSPHSVQYNGKRYPTSEHLFQSFKVCYFIVTIDRFVISIVLSV